MPVQYPLHFTLEDGVVVEVRSTESNIYDFTLTPDNGVASHFTLVDDNRTKEEKTELLSFDQLNAVRAFWLKQHDVV